jgi:sensor c-di-GMP phosphodiesterase-like protein
MNNLLNMSWRNNRMLTGVTILLIIVTAFVSIFLSLMIAQNQAISKETKRLREITSGVLMRMSSTRDQFANVVNHFSHVAEKDACAPQHIQKMQEFNISGFFLQAVAHVKGNRIVCSSISEVFDGVILGTPFRTEPDGTRMWANIKVSDWQNHHLVVMEKAGWAVVLVPSHAIEALGSSEVSVGIFGIESHRLYTSRGTIASEWLKKYNGKQALTFIDKERHMLVYMAPNKLNLTGVVAAMPLQDINDDLISFIQILIPLAMVVGISLGGIFVYMQRTRY